jgi:hypothetical protein
MSRARSLRQKITRVHTVWVAIGACVLLVLAPLAGVSTADAAAPPGGAASPVALGSAAGFSALAGPSIANTGAGTVLALDLGVSGTLAGFPPGTVTGDTHVADAAVETAQNDRQKAYDAAAAQTGGTAFSGDLAGVTFTPGLYSSAAAITNTGTITLDAAGDPNAVFVFQIGAALSSAASAKVVLANGALANNVYWQVVGAISFGANAKFVGTLLCAGAVTFGDGASLKGRALTSSTMALSNSPITKPIDDLVAPVVAINGGPTRSTNDTTPSISGTTDEPGTPLVTVTIGSQVLTARASAGAWTLSAGALTAGPHNVVASVTDPSQNTGTATQVLTVDTSAPGVTITGGATIGTNDTTPTISGTTDEAGTPTVVVMVGGQTLSTTAGPGGAWSVGTGALTETSHSVQASVTDAAGNTGTDSQVLTVDVTVPVLTIDGGQSRSTSDTSPWTYGTTAEQAGTTVHVSLGGQSLTATVQPGGTWGVSAQTLASGTYTVLASITDAAENTGTITQSLQIGSVITTPAVTLDGGATKGTADTTPTVSGTTGEPGTPTVTVTVDSQTLTTTAAAGVWSVDAATLTEGSHTVTASVTASGLTGTARQVLSVDVTDPLVTIDGGATRSTSDTSPWIRGTTPEQPGTIVHVTVAGQSLDSTVSSSHAWGVSADTVAEGNHSVVATVTDVAGNTGSTTQVLTIVPVTPPVTPPVSIDGGATMTTNDATPTISGASDAPANTAVRVSVGSQTLSTTVSTAGLWTIDAATLTEAPHTVVASVTSGGATGTANQVLTVDVTAPVVTIAGGAARSTTDDSPWTRGTTIEPAGTIVQVTVGGQQLTSTVSSGGTWGVSADTLATGPYTVMASITDAAGNAGSVTQTLTIVPVATPPVTPPVTTYRPDAEIRSAGRAFVGRGSYDVSRQQVTSILNGHPAKTATFEVRTTNRGNAADQLRIRGTARSAQFTVAYLYGRKNVTAAVLNGSYRSGTLKPGQSITLTVKVTKVKRAKRGSHRTFTIRGTSAHNPRKVDTVAAVVKVVRG